MALDLGFAQEQTGADQGDGGVEGNGYRLGCCTHDEYEHRAHTTCPLITLSSACSFAHVCMHLCKAIGLADTSKLQALSTCISVLMVDAGIECV